MGGGASTQTVSEERENVSTPASRPKVAPAKVDAPDTTERETEIKNTSMNLNTSIQLNGVSNNKLKKMALGIQGYKDQQRDYDATLSQLDLNKTAQVEWSDPKFENITSPNRNITNNFSSSSQMINSSSSVILSPVDKKKLKELASQDLASHSGSFANLPRGNNSSYGHLPPAGIPVRPFPKDRLKVHDHHNLHMDDKVNQQSQFPPGMQAPIHMAPRFPVGHLHHVVPNQSMPISSVGSNKTSFPIPMGAPVAGSPRIVLISPPGQPALPTTGITPISARPPPTSAPVPVVKETTNVKRNKVQLPTKISHAKPTTGDWLNKRYIVNNYILLDTLGAGSYGEVRLCKDRVSDKLFAIKIISKDFLKKKKNGKTSETYFEDIKREIAIMKKLLHPNVLRLYEVLDDPKVNKMYLVLEYMKRGDLINVLKKRTEEEKKLNGAISNTEDSLATFSPLSDFDLWHIFRQIISGIRFLHFQNVIHGDIKPQNLLLGEDGIVKIADFGISQMLSGSGEKLADAGGTPAFMAPELCENKSFSGQLADIWAIGATIFMLKFGHPPFVAKNIVNLYYKICNDPLTFPGPIDPGFKNLLEGLLEKDPDKRLTMSQIVAHPWFRFPPSAVHKIPPSKPHTPSIAATPHASSKGTEEKQNARTLASKSDDSAKPPPPSNALSFQPPPTYDAEEEAAMKGPIHSASINEVYLSIGGIRHFSDPVIEVGQENLDNAIVDIDEDYNEDDDDDDNEDNEEEGGGSSRRLEEKETKTVVARVRKESDSKQSEAEGVDAAKATPREDQKEEEEDSSNLLKTNWGDDVFQIVDDVNDDDDEEDDEEGDEDGDEFEAKGDADLSKSSGSAGFQASKHEEMTAEEEMRRSRQFLKKNAVKKSLREMKPGESSQSSRSSTQSSPNKSSLKEPTSPLATSSLSNAPTPSHAIQKRFFPPSKENSSKFSARDNYNQSVASLLSNADVDEEPEQLSNEEFQRLMDTLAQQPSKATHLLHKSYDPEDNKSSDSEDDCDPRGAGVNGKQRKTEKEDAFSNLLEFLIAPYSNQKNEVGGAYHSEQGRRPSQEDRCVLQIDLLSFLTQSHLLTARLQSAADIREQLSQITFAAVFDGHNGHKVSQFLAHKFLKRLIEHEKCFDSKHIETAIKDTFLLLDYEVIELLNSEEDPSGSTGVVVWYDGRRNILTVAGVGDSLCVLSRNGRAILMNKMHRLDIPQEKDRVKSKGGTVINNRVNGVLAVSRAFGDIQFKSIENYSNALSESMTSEEKLTKATQLEASSLITAEPDIRSEVITPKTEFAIIASDGVWDVLSPAVAVNIVRNSLLKHKDLHKAAKELTAEALSNHSVDNISVVLLTFHSSFTSIKA